MYRQIDTKIWSDPEVKKLNSVEKFLFIYLITNQHTHLSGIYTLPIAFIEYETEISKAIIIKSLDTLSKGYLVFVDRVSDVIWVVNMLKYQGSGAKIITSVENQLKSLHNTSLIPEFLEHYKGYNIKYENKSNRVSYRVSLQEQEQEQNQNQDQEKTNTLDLTPVPEPSSTLKENIYSEQFLKFWSAYPSKRRGGKPDSWKSWKKKKLDSRIDEILKVLENHINSEQWRSGIIPLASTWLNQERWEQWFDDEKYSKESRHDDRKQLPPETKT